MFLLLALPLGVLAQGSKLSEATLVKDGETVSGYLDKENENAWYKVELPDDGSITFVVKSDDNLVIRYISINIPDNSDAGFYEKDFIYLKDGEEPPFTVSGLKAGTYYIRLKREKNEGNYTMKYTFTPCSYANDAEPNDKWNQAGTLENGQTLQGRLGFWQLISSTTDEDDWYKIEVPGEGSVTFVVKSDDNLVIRYISINILDDSDAGYGEKDYIYLKDGEEPPFTINDLKDGTYYIRLHRESNVGGYTINYTFTPSSYANDPEPNDEWKQASKLENGQTVQGHLGYWRLVSSSTDKDDWYKIEVPDDGTVTFDVKSEETLVIRYVGLYPLNGDGTDVYERDYQYLKDGEEPPFIVDDVAPGTYYVRLHFQEGSGYYGGYRMKYTFTPNRYRGDAEPNDDMEHAIEIKDGETVTGHLGYLYNSSYTDNDDWYKINIAGVGIASFYIEPDTTTSLDIRYIELYDSKKSSKGYIYVHKEAGTLTTTDLKDGTYYLRVHRENGGGEGGYKLTCGVPTRAADSKIRISFEGRNAVRLGVPSEYTVTVENIDSRPSGDFFLVIPVTEDIKLLGAKLPGKAGYVEDLTLDEITYEGDPGNEGMWFVVPSMDPYERYSFTIRAEGLVLTNGRANIKPIVLTSTSLLVVGGLVLLNSAIDYAGDQVIGFCTDVINEQIDIQGGKEVDYYRDKINPRVDHELATYKNETGVAVVAGKRMVKTVVTQALDVIPGGKIINFAGELIETAAALGGSLYRRFWYFIRKDLDPNYKEWEKKWEAKHLDAKVGCNKVVRSFDPNEMVGPVGVGDENYIGETSSVSYRILFENKAEATAPAYRIRISDELDPNIFDLNSVRFGSTSHEGIQYNWIMSRDGNKLSWDIEGIELPPNVNAPEGEGYVTFTVDLKPGLGNKAQLKNKATIIFDYNEPIETNEYVNTFDLKEPTATMASATEKDGVVTINCKGTDGESGISHYQFFASHNQGEYQFIGDAIDPQLAFTLPSGTKASEYTFYALAVDNVGNAQLTPPAAIAVGAGAGDANGDGTVNAADIVEVVNYIMGSPSDKFDAEKADVNGDGTVNAADIVGIVNIIMGV